MARITLADIKTGARSGMLFCKIRTCLGLSYKKRIQEKWKVGDTSYMVQNFDKVLVEKLRESHECLLVWWSDKCL